MFCYHSYNKLALNGTVPEVITEDSGLAGHLHLSHDNTVIRNIPNSDNLSTSSSKLLTSSMSSSILSSSLKLARQLLEENSKDAEKKDDSCNKDVVAITAHDKTQKNEKVGDVEKCLPVVHHVDRFRPITFKLLMQEQITAVSMGTLHTAFVTGRHILCTHTHTLTMTFLFIVLGKCVTTGCNTNGQLGYHRTPMETQPSVVEAIGQSVVMVTCGDSFTTAVTKSM